MASTRNARLVIVSISARLRTEKYPAQAHDHGEWKIVHRHGDWRPDEVDNGIEIAINERERRTIFRQKEGRSRMPLDQLTTLGIAWPITRWGDPVLHRACRPVTDFGPDLWNLLCDMFATNTAANGAGLAAPQIGVDAAVFIYDCLDEFGRRRQGLVCNPQIVLAADPQMNTGLEGCLSLPGAYLPVSRPDVAICYGENQFGEPIKVVGTGTLARCMQHETDHLHGIVMEDHLTAAERRDLRRQHKRVTTYYPEDWPT